MGSQNTSKNSEFRNKFNSLIADCQSILSKQDNGAVQECERRMCEFLGWSKNQMRTEKNSNVFIGSNRTPIPRRVYNVINWTSCTAATRKLLMAAFTREELATHSLSGKPSPAFVKFGQKAKPQLNVRKIEDIVEVVCNKCNAAPSYVRSIITTKCADENKMARYKRSKEKARLTEDSQLTDNEE